MNIIKKAASIFLCVVVILGIFPLSAIATEPTNDTDSSTDDQSEHNSTSTLKEFNGHYYTYYSSGMIWHGAKEYCEAMGGHLVCITSQEENDFVTSIIESDIIIGFSDAENEGVWEWVTGENVEYTNWGLWEPNNQADEDYACLAKSNGTWNDGHCDQEIISFVCEWESYDDLKGIAIFSTEKSLSVQINETMELKFGLLEGGLLNPNWEKMSIVVSDPSVIELSEYKENEYGYYVEVKGKKAGITNISITDTDSGANTSCSITVYDRYTKNYSYDMNNISPFYPNNNYENDIPTYIYDLNGLYVSDYSCVKSGSNYYVSMTVYNSKYHTGSVDVYDANNNWKASYPIEKFSDISSLYDTGRQAFYLVSDSINGNLLTYKQASFSKDTPLTNIKVPDGGYIVISNNFLESPGVYIFNIAEYLANATIELLSNHIADSVSNSAITKFANDIINKIVTNDQIRDAWMDVFKNTLCKKIESKISGAINPNVINLDYAGMVGDFEDSLNSAFKNFNIDYKELLSNALGISQSAFEKFAGPAGYALKLCFKFTELGSSLLQKLHLASSINMPYATFYSNTDEGFINSQGVMINTGGNVDSEAVLQVFKVSSSDTLEGVLDDNNPSEKCEFYNISFVKNDQNVQPNGKVKVYIPIPNDIIGNTGKIYRQENDGSWTMLDAHVENNYLVFETNHFSLYAIVGSVADLSIKKLPSKLQYVVGDTLNSEGLILEINGQQITTGYICEPTVLSQRGEQEIRVRYGESTTVFNVYVSENSTDNEKDPSKDNELPTDDSTAEPKEENLGFFARIWHAILNFFRGIFDFFRGIFGLS